METDSNSPNYTLHSFRLLAVQHTHKINKELLPKTSWIALDLTMAHRSVVRNVGVLVEISSNYHDHNRT